MRHTILLILISNLFIFTTISQTESRYSSPLEIPLILSANFGELRPNHFHMGLDFKTNGKEGVKILAIDNGYISRIKISPYGYGKVVYINHPNGITSVYAHCSKLIGKLDSIVYATQKKEKNFEVEIFLQPNEIKILKGENFALSGNSGSSTAPHLHFELRNTKTETALNPLKFGFDIIDHKHPEIKSLKIYSLSADGYRIKDKSKIYPIQKNKFGYFVENGSITTPTGFDYETEKIGLAFDVTDFYDLAPNPLGVYGSYLIVENDTIFGHKIDSVSFDETRQIHSHTDYEEYTFNNKKYQKSFKTAENPLSIYELKKLGLISIQENDTLTIRYIAYDSKNNKSEVKFKLNTINLHSTTKNPFNNSEEMIYPNQKFIYLNDTTSIYLSEGCIYEPMTKNFKISKELYLGNRSIPLQKPLKISFKLNDKRQLPEKYYISVNSKALSTKLNDGWLIADSKSFGNFCVKTDTISPTITPLNFLKTDNVIKKKVLQWKIKDSNTSLTDYDLYIDDEWTLLEFESKGSYASYIIPNELKGKHLLKLIAKDSCGNNGVWEKELIFE